MSAYKTRWLETWGSREMFLGTHYYDAYGKHNFRILIRLLFLLF
uniref:Uncharacterized protein n=1 Tax=Anguilla anguilla TaxID=7936 RepID=A0A0E9PA19_ANGAN